MLGAPGEPLSHAEEARLRVNARRAAYVAANRERIRKEAKQYYIDNRDRILARIREDKESNPEKYRQYAETEKGKERHKTPEERRLDSLAECRRRYVKRRAADPKRYQEATYDEWKANAPQRHAVRVRACKEKSRVRNRARYAANHEAMKAKCREAAARERRDHPERVRARKNALRARDPEKARVRERAYRAKNIDAIHDNECRCRHRREVSKDPAIVEELMVVSRINRTIRNLEWSQNDQGEVVMSDEAVKYRERIRQHIERYPEQCIEKMHEVHNEQDQAENNQPRRGSDD